MQTQKLDTRLASIQKQAIQQANDYKAGRALTYSMIAEGVFWQIDAEKDPSYLPQTYTAAGITTRAKPGTPGFMYPTVHLLYGFHAKNNPTTASEWSQTMFGLRREVLDNPDEYGSDGVAKLVNKIIDEGGLRAFRGGKVLSPDDLEAEEDAFLELGAGDQGTVADTTENPSDPEAVRKALLDVKLSAAKSQPSKATVTGFHPAYPNDDGLVVFVGRQKPGSADFEVVAASGDDQLMGDVLITAVDMDRSSIPVAARLLTESLIPMPSRHSWKHIVQTTLRNRRR